MGKDLHRQTHIVYSASEVTKLIQTARTSTDSINHKVHLFTNDASGLGGVRWSEGIEVHEPGGIWDRIIALFTGASPLDVGLRRLNFSSDEIKAYKTAIQSGAYLVVKEYFQVEQEPYIVEQFPAAAVAGDDGPALQDEAFNYDEPADDLGKFTSTTDAYDAFVEQQKLQDEEAAFYDDRTGEALDKAMLMDAEYDDGFQTTDTVFTEPKRDMYISTDMYEEALQMNEEYDAMRSLQSNNEKVSIHSVDKDRAASGLGYASHDIGAMIEKDYANSESFVFNESNQIDEAMLDEAYEMNTAYEAARAEQLLADDFNVDHFDVILPDMLEEAYAMNALFDEKRRESLPVDRTMQESTALNNVTELRKTEDGPKLWNENGDPLSVYHTEGSHAREDVLSSSVQPLMADELSGEPIPTELAKAHSTKYITDETQLPHTYDAITQEDDPQIQHVQGEMQAVEASELNEEQYMEEWSETEDIMELDEEGDETFSLQFDESEITHLANINATHTNETAEPTMLEEMRMESEGPPASMYAYSEETNDLHVEEASYDTGEAYTTQGFQHKVKEPPINLEISEQHASKENTEIEEMRMESEGPPASMYAYSEETNDLHVEEASYDTGEAYTAQGFQHEMKEPPINLEISEQHASKENTEIEEMRMESEGPPAAMYAYSDQSHSNLEDVDASLLSETTESAPFIVDEHGVVYVQHEESPLYMTDEAIFDEQFIANQEMEMDIQGEGSVNLFENAQENSENLSEMYRQLFGEDVTYQNLKDYEELQQRSNGDIDFSQMSVEEHEAMMLGDDGESLDEEPPYK